MLEKKLTMEIKYNKQKNRGRKLIKPSTYFYQYLCMIRLSREYNLTSAKRICVTGTCLMIHFFLIIKFSKNRVWDVE